MPPALNPMWWHQPKKIKPLEAIKITAECLERGESVPMPAASIVARALRQYLAGQTDISRNLGLRPRRGGTHETPLRLEQANHRDSLIKAVYAAVPGKQAARAEQTAQLLRSPPDRRITEDDVFKHLVELYESHAGSLPTSARQIIRIVNGDTVAERKK